MTVARLRVEQVFGFVFCAIASAAAIVTVLGSRVIGISWDEPFYVDQMRGYVLSWREGTWRYWFEQGTQGYDGYIYGVAFQGLGHIANVLLGNEELGVVTNFAETYLTRHLLSAFLGGLLAIAVAWSVYSIGKSLLFASFSLAAILSWPLWMGHSMFNPKDVPVAAGVAVVLAASVSLLSSLREMEFPSRRTYLSKGAQGLAVAAGTILAVGTRFTALLLIVSQIAILVVFLLGSTWLMKRQTLYKRGTLTQAICVPVGGFGVGCLGIFLLHPFILEQPIRFAQQLVAATSSDGVPTHTVLTGGVLTASTNPPWWYLPAWFFASTPLTYLALLVVGVFSALVMPLYRLRRKPFLRHFWAPKYPASVLLVLVSLSIFSVGVTVTNQPMFDAQRHYLFLLPYLGILIAFGAQEIYGFIISRFNKTRVPEIATLTCLSAALLVPFVVALSLHPYQYTFVNVLAAQPGIKKSWETDYWGLSVREGMQKSPSYGAYDVFPYASFVFEPDRGSKVEIESRESGEPPGTRWLFSVSRGLAGDPKPPKGCEEAGEVQRQIWGQRFAMSYIYRCQDEPS